MNIAILGAGNIGSTLGKKWQQAGHRVVFGVRDPHSPKVAAARKSIGEAAEFLPIPDAIVAGEVILLSVPYSAVAHIVAENAAGLCEKVIIDATNNFGAMVINNIHTIRTAVPEAQIYRAFNASGWENFADPFYGGIPVDLFYCGPDGDSRGLLEGLIGAVGLRPVYLGGLEMAPVVDALGTLWVTLSFKQGFGRGIALKLLQR